MTLHRLPRDLSPKAKHRLIRAGTGDRVRTVVMVAASADSEDLTRGVAALGGTAQSWSGETRLLTAELPAGQLGNLAKLDGVVHVDADDVYRP